MSKKVCWLILNRNDLLPNLKWSALELIPLSYIHVERNISLEIKLPMSPVLGDLVATMNLRRVSNNQICNLTKREYSVQS